MTGTKEDRSYIKKLLLIAIPIIVQNGISNFVNLLDNLMIGRVGTNALSGVAIANQLTFVFYLVIFGATAGVGIFTAQYKGNLRFLSCHLRRNCRSRYLYCPVQGQG